MNQQIVAFSKTVTIDRWATFQTSNLSLQINMNHRFFIQFSLFPGSSYLTNMAKDTVSMEYDRSRAISE